jgi:hypothetical protein
LTKIAASVRALQAVLAALVLLGAVSLSGEQLGGIVVAVEMSLAGVAAWLNPSIPFGPSE